MVKLALVWCSPSYPHHLCHLKLVLYPFPIFSSLFLNVNVYVSHSVLSNSLQPHELQPTRILCPWNFSGKSTGVGCHFLLHGSSQPRDQTCDSCIVGRFFTIWATRGAQVLIEYMLVRICLKELNVCNSRKINE